MTVALLVALMLAASGSQSPEPKPVPKDSVELEARGCLKGRVFTATSEPEDEGVRRGPDVIGRHFRLNGKREVMDSVKAHNGHRVAVVGLVKKSDLADQGVGMKVGGARVVIGAQGADPNSRMNSQMSAPTMAVMDVVAIRDLAAQCSVPQ
jgi:hypothetical protein